MAEELWERQLRAIIEKEGMKGSFGMVPEGQVIPRKEAVWALHSGYVTGRLTPVDEICCPLSVDANNESARLYMIAEYVGGADKILEKGPDEYLRHAVQIYYNLGIMYTSHVQRKLRRYADMGPEHKARLETAFTNLGIFETDS